MWNPHLAMARRTFFWLNKKSRFASFVAYDLTVSRKNLRMGCKLTDAVHERIQLAAWQFVRLQVGQKEGA